MKQSNIKNRNTSDQTITMAEFQKEWKRLKPGLRGQGNNIALRAGVHPNGFMRYKSGVGGTTIKGQQTLYRILQAAKDIYRELLAQVDAPVKT